MPHTTTIERQQARFGGVDVTEVQKYPDNKSQKINQSRKSGGNRESGGNNNGRTVTFAAGVKESDGCLGEMRRAREGGGSTRAWVSSLESVKEWGRIKPPSDRNPGKGGRGIGG